MAGLAAEVSVAGVRLEPEKASSSLSGQGRREEDVIILDKRRARIG